ncbi:MAG: GDSL-type esterase/lipase family protein [Verrucomicrobiaceae bacterium]
MKPFFVFLLLTAAVFAKDLPKPERFEKAIAAFEQADKDSKAPKAATLFVGASNIRRWESLPDRFKKDKVINRGFGGAFLSEVLHFADRIVLPYEPKQIYLNAGGNDLHVGRTPEEVLASFKAFAALVAEKLPKTKLAFLCIPTSPSRWDEVETVRATNKLIADFIHAGGDKIEFIDYFPMLLGADGKPRAELYVDDKLHFSEAGYDVVTSVIKWQKEIKAIEARYSEKAAPKAPIVFIGSSSIRRWETLAADFPDKPVLNHGFGGSEVFDSVNYAHRLVFPFQPKQIVMYAGGNDLNAGKTPERVLADFQAFVAKVQAELPKTKICYISTAPNPKRWAQIKEVRAANALIQAFCAKDDRLQYLDVHPIMLAPNGEPKPDIFVEDQLHMNAKGYELWKGVVGPVLME